MTQQCPCRCARAQLRGLRYRCDASPVAAPDKRIDALKMLAKSLCIHKPFPATIVNDDMLDADGGRCEDSVRQKSNTFSLAFVNLDNNARRWHLFRFITFLSYALITSPVHADEASSVICSRYCPYHEQHWQLLSNAGCAIWVAFTRRPSSCSAPSFISLPAWQSARSKYKYGFR